ncbi:hypothetical protein N9L68_02910 [bacterium]|nr:hypothetical protein [bacterium]
MADGAASTRGASQPATGASPIGGASREPSSAPLEEHAQERRRALDGERYTMEESMHIYQNPYGSFSAWRSDWDRVVRGAVSRGSASSRGASQIATVVSPTGGTYQAPSGAPRLEDVVERRQALNREWYTMDQFRQYDQKPDGHFLAWRRFWDRDVREASPPEPVSTPGASQPATVASSIGGACQPRRSKQAHDAHQQDEARAEEMKTDADKEKSEEQEDKYVDDMKTSGELLQAILLHQEQASPVGAEATVGEVAEQAASLVGSGATVGESMAALPDKLRARNDDFLHTACAHQAHLSEAWERICQRPGRATGRDEIQTVPGLVATAAYATELAAAPAAHGASQLASVLPVGLQLALVEPSWQSPGLLQASLLQQEQASPVGAETTVGGVADQAASPVSAEATVGEKMASLFEELRARNEECLQAVCADQAQRSKAWERIRSQMHAKLATRERILGAASGIESQPKQEKPAKASPFAPGNRFAQLAKPATFKASPYAPGSRLAFSSRDYFEPRRDNHATNATQR